MRQLFLAACTAFALVAPSAFAHEDAHKDTQPGASPQAQAAKPKAAAAGTHDPRAYFTDTGFVTQDGRKVRFYTDMLKDRVVIVNVMYASCKEACPLITRQLTEVRDDLGELFGKTVFFVSITSDPERDTPEALKRFAKEQHADVAGWSFLTGSKDDVDGILRRFGAYSENVEEHATVLYILDVDNKRMRRMLPNLPPKAIAEAARIIAAADKRVASTAAPVRD